jgi:hypothetical protein
MLGGTCLPPLLLAMRVVAKGELACPARGALKLSGPAARLYDSVRRAALVRSGLVGLGNALLEQFSEQSQAAYLDRRGAQRAVAALDDAQQ